MSLDIEFTISSFMNLARVEAVRVEGDEIVGRFSSAGPLVVSDVVRASEDYANCSHDPAAILRFTRKYGPALPAISADPGASFHFSCDEWRKYHRVFQIQWRDSVAVVRRQSAADPVKRVPVPKDGCFVFSGKGNTFQVANVSVLFYLCLAAIPNERLRFCPAADCGTYFVAHHLKQTYCGKPRCIEWGKRKLKLEYWERNKEQLLAKRRQKERKPHGPRKAR